MSKILDSLSNIGKLEKSVKHCRTKMDSKYKNKEMNSFPSILLKTNSLFEECKFGPQFHLDFHFAGITML